MLLLNCPSMRKGVNALGQGVTRDRVNLTTLLTLLIVRPSVEEQIWITEKIEAIDKRIQREHLSARSSRG